jgi:hypothetical protein
VLDWVLAAERAYVAAAVGRAAAARPGHDASAHPPATELAAARPGPTPAHTAWAIAAAGAIASRYLAVGTPRSFGILIDDAGEVDAAALALTAHRTWFDPRDVRCAATRSGGAELAAATGGRRVSIAEALACDIANVYGAAIAITPASLRRGTHVNAAWAGSVDDELRRLARCVREAELPALAAGLVDGRQLDELTIFTIDGAPIALAAQPR